MTPAVVAQLCSDLLAAKVGFCVSPNPTTLNDWVVTANPGGTVDAKQIAALETKYSISSPVTSTVTFV